MNVDDNVQLNETRSCVHTVCVDVIDTEQMKAKRRMSTEPQHEINNSYVKEYI